MCVKGNGASIMALRESGVDTADIIIAATSLDEVNMVCCLTAKRLGAKYTIARVRNVEYAVELCLKRNWASTWSLTPRTPRRWRSPGCCASPRRPISRPSTGVGWELIGFRVQEDDFIWWPTLGADHRVKELPILFCAAERGR